MSIYFMKRVKDCKDVSIILITPQDQQWRDDIEFVTEFPCLLGHPVVYCDRLFTISHALKKMRMNINIEYDLL